MPIKYLVRKEIDDKLWDKTIDESCNKIIYGFSWYLDAVTNKSWDALVLNDYEFVMPLPKRKKFFISYIFLPMFSQQLGIFGKIECPPKLVADFFNTIPKKFKHVSISTSNDVSEVINFNKTVRQTQILDLSASYETISARYKQSAKRNIKDANKHQLSIKENIGIDEYLKFQYKWSPASDFIHSNRKIIKNLIYVLQKQCVSTISGVYDKEELLSIIIYITDSQRVYCIDGSSSKTGREKKSFFLMLDYLIQKYAKNKKIFDFNGSIIKTIAFRNLCFGSISRDYNLLSQNNLPWFVKLIKKIDS